MSESIVIDCDYGNGECFERFDGFRITASMNTRDEILESQGWAIVDGDHFCPKHAKEI